MKKKDKKEQYSELIDASSVGLNQRTGILKVIFGMLCRFAVAFVGVSGVCMMLDDAFKFFNGESDPARVLYLSFIFCAVIYAVFIAMNTHVIALGIAVFALIVTFAFIDMQNGFKQSLVYIPLSAWNHILLRLDSLGYSSLTGLMSTSLPLTNPRTSEGAMYVTKAFHSFIALVSFIFVSCTYKRVRTVPVIVTAGIVMTVTFTYNILTDNLGFVMMVASGFGVLVMKYSDIFTRAQYRADKKAKLKFFAKRRLQLVHASTRGFAAFTATALIFAVAAVPAAKIHRPAPELSVFNDFMDAARDVVGTFLTGSGSPSGDDPFAGHKSTEPTQRTFRNRRIMTVTATSYIPLYLRSWVGEEYKNNQWMTAKGDGDILPEEITELFYTIVDIDCNILAQQTRADTSTMKRGFAKEFVTVKTAEKRTYTYLSSRFSTLYGLTDPSDMNAKYAGGYWLKKGVGTAELYQKDNSYGMVTYAQNYKSVSLSQLNKDMMIYNIVYPYVFEYVRAVTGGADGMDERLAALKNNVAADAQEKGVEIPAGCIVNRLGEMSDDDCRALFFKMKAAQAYEESVYGVCLSMPWSEREAILEIACEACGVSGYTGAYYEPLYGSSASIVAIPGENVMSGNPDTRMSDIYTLADKTARYLSEHCEYTLDPHGYSVYGSYALQFLTSAKNGYCVQFATAGALMLRSLGIPTRYVDGYIAPDMDYNGTSYSCKVLDNNAHAWIEVYVNGYGWMTFEMTAPMMSGMYSQRTPTVTPDTEQFYVTTDDIDTETSRTTPHTTPVTTSDSTVTTAPEETTTEVTSPFITAETRKILIIIGASLLALLIVSSIIYLYLKKTTARQKKLLQTLERAAAGKSETPDEDIDRIAAYLKLLFSKVGLVRAENELMTEFVQRVDEKTGLETFGYAADALEKNAFGHCAEGEDAKHAAEYALKLRAYVAGKMNGIQRFYYVSLRKLI